MYSDGQRDCPKHAELYSKNKFGKLVHLVGFIIRVDYLTWLNCPTREKSEGLLWTRKERCFRTKNSSGILASLEEAKELAYLNVLIWQTLACFLIRASGNTRNFYKPKELTTAKRAKFMKIVFWEKGK